MPQYVFLTWIIILFFLNVIYMYMSFGYDLWWIEELVAQLVVVLHILVSIEW